MISTGRTLEPAEGIWSHVDYSRDVSATAGFEAAFAVK